ncbi:MAG: tetratricopeptide repeat protein [Kiritimatiellaceae bacterium]|nr:tetratricopeptide repeat protein [Kiritimatiellaceae bacterium]
MADKYRMGKPADRRNSTRTVLAVCFLLALMVWGVFGQTLRYKFTNFDDNNYVHQNPAISKGVTLEGLRWVVTHPHVGNWHPLTSFSHMLDCQFYGLNPAGHHFTNVLFHMATVILLFLVLRQMTGSLWRSAFVAAVFAIHPLRAESVAWISERKDVLSGFFFMLTLGAYTRYARVAGGGWRVTSRRYLAVVLFFVLGLMSKSMLATLPCVLLLLDFWPLGRLRHMETKKTLIRLVLEKVPLLLLLAVFCAVTIWAQRQSIASVETLSVLRRFENALCSYAIYIKQLIFPIRLSPFYTYAEAGISWQKAVASLTLLVGISWGVFAGRKKHPYLPIGWLWYLGMLVPVVGIVQVGDQAHADRYTYLPQIGLVMAGVWLIADWCTSLRYRRTVLSVAAVVVLSVLAIAAYKQTRHWRDDFSLWTHAVTCSDRNDVAHLSLGATLIDRGQFKEAISHLEKAIEINPYPADTYHNTGVAFLQMGQFGKAILYFKKALGIDPNYGKSHYGLGLALQETGNPDEALMHYKKYLEINPDDAKPHCRAGDLLLRQSNFVEAIWHYEQALRINPDYVEVKNNLAWILATCPDATLRDGRRAVELALFVNRLSGESCAPVLDTLAAAYAEAGRYPEAVATARRALDLAAGQESVAEGIRARLRLYEAGIPYHESGGEQ